LKQPDDKPSAYQETTGSGRLTDEVALELTDGGQLVESKRPVGPPVPIGWSSLLNTAVV